jgi:type II restriction enzyme
MKFIEKYKQLGVSDSEETFIYLQRTLKDTIRTYDFFVAWNKISSNVREIETPLNILNTLIGKENPKIVLSGIIREYPQVVPVLPLLLAIRDKNIKIADISGDIEYTFGKKEKYSEEAIVQIANFMDKSGLLKFIADKNIKNLVDYATGVEVGLDTNARKNRSGTTMENLSEGYVKSICEQHGFRYLAQATADKIEKEFGYKVPTDKSGRYFDFVIKTPHKIYLLEVNYYGGGGSKLKAVAGEFKSLFNLVKTSPKIGFVWLTDGLGWQTALRPLRETFDATDFMLNLSMVNDGILEEILTKES